MLQQIEILPVVTILRGLNFPKFSVMFKIILKYIAYFMYCNFETKFWG